MGCASEKGILQLEVGCMVINRVATLAGSVDIARKGAKKGAQGCRVSMDFERTSMR